VNRATQAKKIVSGLKLLAKKSERLSLNELRLVIALERAIARIEQHPRLSENLIFKGGFVLLKTLESTRFTRDVDALAIGIPRASIVEIVEEALIVDLDDGLWFGDINAEDLKDQGPYGGFRFSCAFQIGDPPKEKSKIRKLSRLHIDIGYGDAVNKMTPKQPMPQILIDSRPVSWSVYPLEYIFAEKLEALFSRGSANSRAKDIYDMPLIFPKCKPVSLVDAIKKTFKGRQTPIPKSFAAAAYKFSLNVMQGAWRSVDLHDSSDTFDSCWAALLTCLDKIDANL
jgi:hypothetical protein